MCRGCCEACQAAGRQDDGERGGKTGKQVVRSSIQAPLKAGAKLRPAGILLVLPTEEVAIRRARRLGFKLIHDPCSSWHWLGSSLEHLGKHMWCWHPWMGSQIMRLARTSRQSLWVPGSQMPAVSCLPTVGSVDASTRSDAGHGAACLS